MLLLIIKKLEQGKNEVLIRCGLLDCYEISLCTDETASPLQMLNDLFLLFPVLQKEIAQLTCDCERHIGTQSGGMDQVN